jgi:hypothetical protein
MTVFAVGISHTTAPIELRSSNLGDVFGSEKARIFLKCCYAGA